MTTNNNENTSNCKDCMGHTLRHGDWVDVLPPQNMKWIGKIVEIVEGGLSLSIDKQRSMTPAKVRVVMDITMNADPRMPVFSGLTRTSPPGSDDVVEKIMEAAEQPPPSKPLIS